MTINLEAIDTHVSKIELGCYSRYRVLGMINNVEACYYIEFRLS